MKNFTLSLIGLLFSAGAFGQSPITLTSGTIPATPLVSVKATATTNGVVAPMRGTNMSWNYSGLATTSMQPLNYVPATNAQAPNANFMLQNQFAELVPSYGYDYHGLMGYNAMLFGRVGRVVPAQSYSMMPATGIATDSLTIPEQVAVYTAEQQLLQFPVMHNSAWSNYSEFALNALVDVTPFGLNNAPMQKRSFVLTQDSVIGWGTLQVPTGNGPSMPYQVLMVKQMEVTTDSLYLNGAPAPPALLGAMGLTQGQVTRDNSYLFYRSGSVFPLAEFRYGASPFSNLIEVNYDRSSSIQPNGLADELAAFPVQLFPNPANGNNITIQFEKADAGNWHFTLTDLAGRLVYQQPIGNGATAVDQRIAIPASAANGLYLWHLADENGNLKAAGKVSLAR